MFTRDLQNRIFLYSNKQNTHSHREVQERTTEMFISGRLCTYNNSAFLENDVVEFP